MSLKGFDADARKLINDFLNAGWTGRRTSSGHWLGYSPDGNDTVTIASKLGGPNRGKENAEAVLKRWLAKNPPAPKAAKPVTPADLPKPKPVSDPLRILSQEPWLARRNPNQQGGVFYKSKAVIERTWSNGTVDYRCSMVECDYINESPVSVARHYGRKHSEGTDRSYYEDIVPGVDYVESPPTKSYKPQARIVDALADFLSSNSWDNVDELATLILEWMHERPDLENTVREARQLTDTEIVSRIRTLVWQSVEVELANSKDEVSGLLETLQERTSERDDANARLAAVERDLAAVQEMLGSIGRVSTSVTLSESDTR